MLKRLIARRAMASVARTRSILMFPMAGPESSGHRQCLKSKGKQTISV
jgi:hypothetical protein